MSSIYTAQSHLSRSYVCLSDTVVEIDRHQPPYHFGIQAVSVLDSISLVSS